MGNLHLLQENFSQAQSERQKDRLYIPLFINPAKYQGLLVTPVEV